MEGLAASAPDVVAAWNGWTKGRSSAFVARCAGGQAPVVPRGSPRSLPRVPTVVPNVPGRADADREALLRRIATSQRIVDRAARSIAGHELEPCPLDHPLVGRLCCGEWLLFAGVHDMMHIAQLERLTRSVAAR